MRFGRSWLAAASAVVVACYGCCWCALAISSLNSRRLLDMLVLPALGPLACLRGVCCTSFVPLPRPAEEVYCSRGSFFLGSCYA
uniref:Putative secreted peptide n=1 Tax=Anopheles braziliensis TaxID=58242 RepID=A0A2M3ZMG0_9DIPT